MKKSNYGKLTLLGLIILILFSGHIFAQDENAVTGRVFPAGMRTPMRDVTVQIQGDDASIILTDGNGSFKMEVQSFPVSLVFSKETYATQVVTVNKA